MSRITLYETGQDLLDAVQWMVTPAETVLDIGCGIMPETFVKPLRLHILADPDREYTQILRERYGDNPRYFILCGPGHEIVSQFLTRSVDSVFSMDVIEHMPKAMGKELIEDMERVARRQVVLFTPLGFLPQSSDVWGYHAHELQTHRSGWMPEDFDDSWRTLICRQFHTMDHHGDKRDEPCGAMFCVKTKYVTPDVPYAMDFTRRRLMANLDELTRLPVQSAVKLWHMAIDRRDK